MTAIWAYCRACERWFYCDEADDPDPTCPVCCQRPSAVRHEDEATGNVA